MAFTVHKKILTSRSDFFRDMLASTPTPADLKTALNGVIKSSAKSDIQGDAMPCIEVTSPDAQIKTEVKAEDVKDTKLSISDEGNSTISLPDDEVISVKSFIDWAYSGIVTMTPGKETFHLEIWLFADKVSEAYCNDFMDSFRAYYFNKTTYMNQSALNRLYAVGLRGSPPALSGLKALVYASMKWPKQWVKEEKVRFSQTRGCLT